MQNLLDKFQKLVDLGYACSMCHELLEENVGHMTYDFLQLSKETYPDLFWLSPAGWLFASMEHLRAEVREQIRASQRRLCELLAGMLLAKNKVVHVFVSCPHGRRVLRRVCAKFSNLGISFPGS